MYTNAYDVPTQGYVESVSTIRKDSSYVDAFGNTRTQDDRYITIEMNMINSVLLPT